MYRELFGEGTKYSLRNLKISPSARLANSLNGSHYYYIFILFSAKITNYIYI